MPYIIERNLKTTVRRPQKHSNPKFSWGSMPPDPPRQRLALVLKPQPPHFCRSFSTLAQLTTSLPLYFISGYTAAPNVNERTNFSVTATCPVFPSVTTNQKF